MVSPPDAEMATRHPVDEALVAEVVILDEMAEAGIEALAEAQHRDLDPQNTVIAVYMAMRCIEEMVVLKGEGGIH